MLTQIDQNQPEDLDFIIEGNHARISQEKVAEITKVNQSTVSRWLCTNNLDTSSSSNVAYLSGYALKEFVSYLVFDAKRINKEVRNHNIKLLSDASDYGFQMLIDKMAGLNLKESNSNELTLDEAKLALDIVLTYATHTTAEEKTQMVVNSLTAQFPHLTKFLQPIQVQARIATANDNIPVTVTALGKKIGVSGQKMNKLLVEKRFQVKNLEAKSRREPSYLPTPKGEEFCKFTSSTGKNGDNTLYQQLLWYESVLAEL